MHKHMTPPCQCDSVCLLWRVRVGLGVRARANACKRAWTPKKHRATADMK